MQLCRIIYYSLAALHVSSDIFAHHQDHLLYNSFWYYTRMSLPADIMGVLECWVPTIPWYQLAATYVCNTRSCNSDAPDDEQKYRSKHVEQPRNNKLSYTVASCWSFSYIILCYQISKVQASYYTVICGRHGSNVLHCHLWPAWL